MECRIGCGACCIAPSISSAIPAMPAGKPAGTPCAHLTADYTCALFGRPERPAACREFRATAEVCGRDRDEALTLLERLERRTAPDPWE